MRKMNFLDVLTIFINIVGTAIGVHAISIDVMMGAAIAATSGISSIRILFRGTFPIIDFGLSIIYLSVAVSSVGYAFNGDNMMLGSIVACISFMAIIRLLDFYIDE